jgi:putative FmdB family regulatory protein
LPIYEYKCENGHLFEEIQKMADDPLTVCTQCGAPVQRVFHPVAVHFKGSGFYTTDYGSKKSNAEKKADSGESKGSDSNSGSSDSASSDSSSSSDSKSSDSKSGAAKSSSD